MYLETSDLKIHFLMIRIAKLLSNIPTVPLTLVNINSECLTNMLLDYGQYTGLPHWLCTGQHFVLKLAIILNGHYRARFRLLLRIATKHHPSKTGRTTIDVDQSKSY